MNVANLASITSDISAGWDRQAVENRLRSIAANAIREARIALGRDAGPWLDDDARRLNIVFDILHLAEMPDMSNEALPMASPVQAARNEVLDGIEKTLFKLDDEVEVRPTSGVKTAKK